MDNVFRLTEQDFWPNWKPPAFTPFFILSLPVCVIVWYGRNFTHHTLDAAVTTVATHTGVYSQLTSGLSDSEVQETRTGQAELFALKELLSRLYGFYYPYWLSSF